MAKILIIDDEPEMLHSLKKILSQRKEYAVDLSQDPHLALEIVKATTFDLIITDSTDPIGPGVVLFQEPYYRAVNRALKPDGMMACQSESPWFYNDVLADMTKSISKIFQHVETYIAMIPLYLPGLWNITFESDLYSLKNFDQAKSEQISQLCKYYNPTIHIAALAQPNFLQQIVNNK